MQTWRHFGCLGLLLSSMAWGQTANWGLSWKSPPECIQPSELVHNVEEKLGKAVFGQNPEFRIDGFIKRSEKAPRWKGRLTLLDAQGAVLGSREVSSDETSCRAIDASLALVVAVMIDPTVALSGKKAEEPPPVESPPPPTPSPSLPPPVPPGLSATRTRLGLRAGLSPAPFPSPALFWALHTQLSDTLFIDVRLPLLPWAPAVGFSQTGFLTGAGLGVDAGYSFTHPSSRGIRWQTSVGLEAHVFMGFSSTRTDMLARLDALWRLGAWVPLPFGTVVVMGEAGICPYPPNFRMVTSDGRPDDVGVGSTFRTGLELAFVLPLG